jgi:hypothetical protein
LEKDFFSVVLLLFEPWCVATLDGIN